MAQDKRLALFNARSGHRSAWTTCLVARRLLHGRDIGELFDFLTWLEFALADAPTFNELLRRLRGLEKRSYVERAAEAGLQRSPG